MRLIQLTLTDFGVYRGKVSFDLATKDKPIVIFGGMNGSGKTTVLEAIKLCLYGIKALGHKYTKHEYEDYIRNRVHRQRSAIIPLSFTSIELKFSYSHSGEDHEYVVTRYWKMKAGNVQENLDIVLDGKRLSGIPDENWQEYLDDLVPPTVADLFFFDGEKIQSLVIDNFNQQSLSTEVKRLLGLNIVERLQADLDTYIYRQRKENTLPELQKQLDEADEIFKQASQNYRTKELESAQTKSRLDNIIGHIETSKRKIDTESSGYALKREFYVSQLNSIDLEIESIEKEVHELSAGLLPFALIPELCNQLKERLIAESKIQQWQSSKNLITPRINSIQEKISSNEFWSKVNGHMSNESRQLIVTSLSQLLSEVIPTESEYEGVMLLHQVSDLSRMHMITWIDEAIQRVPLKIKKLSERISYLEHQRQDLTVRLRNVPDNSVLQPLVEELNSLESQRRDYEAIYTLQEQEKKSLLLVKDEAQRKFRRAYDNVRAGKRLEERLGLVEKTQVALDDFLLRMTKRRIGELEDLIVKHFNSLARKPDLLARLEIHPQTFEIVLYDVEGNHVPKDLLSAGEKQMFAIALLWALRDLSGKPFPVIIDTPLGRLDSDHRENLVTKYFPNVSHQVVLFSTDTEIDDAYFKSLENNVSHSFYLSYDSKIGSTKVEEGYFWNRG